jgi:hypothetical protein
VSPSDVELVRLGRINGRIRLGIAALALLLLVAIVKPWPGHGGAGPAGSPSLSPRELVAAASVEPTSSSAPASSSAATSGSAPSSGSAAAADAAGALCLSPDSWWIVADDTELGRSVRTWLVADVEYSAGPPARSTIPVTTLLSRGVVRLGFCPPSGLGGPGVRDWSGTLWRQGAGSADPTQWRLAARWGPAAGSAGALAYPVDHSAAAWPPGLYFLEANSAGSDREAWLGLLIQGGAT